MNNLIIYTNTTSSNTVVMTTFYFTRKVIMPMTEQEFFLLAIKGDFGDKFYKRDLHLLYNHGYIEKKKTKIMGVFPHNVYKSLKNFKLCGSEYKPGEEIIGELYVFLNDKTKEVLE